MGPGPPRHRAARGPRSESPTSNPKQPSPDPATEGLGGCPHSGDARSTAQLVAKERKRLRETKGAETLAGLRPLTVRAQPASEAETRAQGPTLDVPTGESGGGSGLPSPGHACTPGKSL